MVIFGAGASYDSCSTFTDQSGNPTLNPWRPPLADELFDRRFEDQIHLFKECLDVVTHLQKRQGTNLEVFLQKMYEASTNDHVTLRQLVAIRYYLQHMLTYRVNGWSSVIKGVSNYRTLINDIRPLQQASKEKVCLVTFNYDTLLEDELQKAPVNVKIQSVDDYVASDWPIFKLHGSVNWGRVLSTYLPGTAKKEMMLRIRDIIDKSPLEVSETYVLDSGASGLVTTNASIPAGARLLFPAIAIPMQKKDEFELPHEHQKQLEKMLPRVSKVLIIGWRGEENKFTQMLKTTLGGDTEYMVVSSAKESAQGVINTISKAGVPGRAFHPANGGFTSAISTGEIERFLAP
jgi:hypothetical protein